MESSGGELMHALRSINGKMLSWLTGLWEKKRGHIYFDKEGIDMDLEAMKAIVRAVLQDLEDQDREKGLQHTSYVKEMNEDGMYTQHKLEIEFICHPKNR
jgi:hypothetical protein